MNTHPDQNESKAETTSVRIMLADDNELVRRTLRAILESRPGLTVIGEAVCGIQAVEQASTLNPDVIFMDISMPWLNGIAATEQIRTRAPGTRVIALSVHNERHYIQSMLTAGARGFLAKDCTPEDIDAALRAVMTGQTYISPPRDAAPGDPAPSFLDAVHPTAKSVNSENPYTVQMITET